MCLFTRNGQKLNNYIQNCTNHQRGQLEQSCNASKATVPCVHVASTPLRSPLLATLESVTDQRERIL